MNEADIIALNENGICTVVAKDPAAVKFVDPIPSISSRTEIEAAAIQLSRKLLDPAYWSDGKPPDHIFKTFMHALVQGTPLDPRMQASEMRKRIFTQEMEEETRRLARIEAKEEREAAKKAKLEAAKKQEKKP